MIRRPRTRLALLLPIAGCSYPGAPSPESGDGRDFVRPPSLETIEQAVYDCSERTDTGYVQGDPFEITVVSVDGEPVERDTANAYIVMQAAAAEDGVDIRIVSGFRTMDEQRYFWNCYQNCNCNNCNLAARPGFSNHQSGHALDLNTAAGGVLRWLNAHGADYGFERTVPSEDWHWEWWGGGPGGGPCVGLPCDPLPAEGGLVDDASPCFRAFGPSNYWRIVDGEGEGGRLRWTNAFASAEPDNWARWTLNLAAAGDYEVEVRTGGAYGIWPRTRYTVRHAGAEDDVIIDQSAVDGWQSLGVFAFAAGEGQSVDVFDNYDGDVPGDQHILVDAVRVRPHVPPPPDAEVAPTEPETPDAQVTPTEPPPGDDTAEAGPTPTEGDPADAGPAGPDPDDEPPTTAPTPPDGDAPEGAAPPLPETFDGGATTPEGPGLRTTRAAFDGRGGCTQRPGATGPGATALLLLLAARARRRRRPPTTALLVATGVLAATALPGCEYPGPGPEGRALPALSTVQAALNREQRMARYAQIRDAAAARGLTRTGYLLGGIAHAETGLAHCWSEAQWACQGPDSADCGGGPVIAGSADGPCADRQGGLGMFQFDAGTFDDTLGRYGRDVLLVAGNVSHAIDYVVNMTFRSQYTRNAENEERALIWLQNFDIDDATLRDQWIRTVTHYYNGCRPDYGCWNQRYASYNDSLQTVIDETGLDFWAVEVEPPDAPPQGNLEAAACDGVRGWANDPDDAAAALDVHVYFGGPAGGAAPGVPVRADVRRDDLCGPLGSCEHGFALPPPLSLFDGTAHPVHAYAIGAEGGANAELDGSPATLQCEPVLPDGGRRLLADAGPWRLDPFFDEMPARAETVDARPEGDDFPAAPRLVRADDGNPAVYVVDGGARRHVSSPAIMAAWHFDFGAVETLPAAELADLTEGPAWPPRPVWVRTSSGASVVIDPMPRGAIDPPPARDADVEPEPTPDAGPPGERPDATPPGPFADAGPEPVAPGVDAAAAPTAPADSLTAAGPRTRQAALDGRAGCAATTGGLVSAGPGLFALVALGGLVRRRRGTGVRG